MFIKIDNVPAEDFPGTHGGNIMDTFHTCPTCHASVNACFPFCDQCGTPLSEEASTAKETEQPENFGLTPTETTSLSVKQKNPKKHNKKRKPSYLIVSIVLYCLAACFLLACLTNLVSALSVQNSLFGGLTGGSSMPDIASCIFNGILSVILTVLGSTFLLLFQLDK